MSPSRQSSPPIQLGKTSDRAGTLALGLCGPKPIMAHHQGDHQGDSEQVLIDHLLDIHDLYCFYRWIWPNSTFYNYITCIMFILALCTVLGAHELWARRTLCKVFFLNVKLSKYIWGRFWLKKPWSRRFRQSFRSGRNHWKTIVNKRTRPKQCWINFSGRNIM